MLKTKILVLGSTGFIGINLVKQLIIEGAKVMSFSTSTTHPVQKIIHKF